jgi:hypothetical protein
MAIRFSDAATALQAGDAGLRRALANCSLTFFTGTQPTSANDSYGSSQPIISFTNADGVLTADVPAVAVYDLTGWTTADTLTSITVASYEVLGTAATTINFTNYATATLAAAAVAAQINNYLGAIDFTASSSGATFTIYAPKNSGAVFNNAAVIVTGVCASAGHIKSGGTPETANATPYTFTGNGRFGNATGGGTVGVAAANGLTFMAPANNTTDLTYDLIKPTSEVWKGKNGMGPADAALATTPYSGIVDGTTYTAGWGRLLCSAGDSGSAATSGTTGYVRVDFSVGTSGTDFIMSPAATFTVNIATPIETTINTFTLQVAKNLA